MDESSANPYASPAAEVSIPPRVTTFGELVPLWTWLTVAVLTAVFGTPTDPICMLLALAYGLLSFCVGAVVGSRWHILLRIVLLALWGIVTVVFPPPVVFGSYFVVFGACYGIISIVLGMWAWRHIRHKRLRIVVGFVVGFVIGSLLGPLGTSAGAVLGAVLAKRPLGMPNSLGDGL